MPRTLFLGMKAGATRLRMPPGGWCTGLHAEWPAAPGPVTRSRKLPFRR